MKTCANVVIGGGAAGICAAISKARRGEPVIICEKSQQLGKKLLVTGNGRCNLLNDNLDESFYNPAGRHLVKSIFQKFAKADILNFFENLGLHTYSQDGRVFPVTNQSSSVLKVLEMELKRLAIPIEYGFDCSGISSSKGSIIIASKSEDSIVCRAVIITGGGKSYPSFGSDGSIYEIARQLGHTIIEPVPSAVPLVVKDPLCHLLQGQRIQARAWSVINGKPGEQVTGELLFTKYGLSGTCILDVSEEISIALNRHGAADVNVSIDMAPLLSSERLYAELERRRKAKFAKDEMLTGILPNKFCTALANLFESGNLEFAVDSLKNRRFKVAGTRGWNEAEFTAGGVAADEIRPGTLESKLQKGVYFAGEVLDVNGKRGGYNLAWAWASGFIAGMTQ
jgi:predicted Rossmann fold flavoprotein